MFLSNMRNVIKRIICIAAPPPVPKRIAFGCRKVTSDVRALGYAPAPTALNQTSISLRKIRTK
jgi:hypothetical protein